MARAENAEQTALEVVASRFPSAVAAWLGGSIVRGNATATSDLDITVLVPGPPAPYRDSIMFGGWPVELFVHTERSLAHYRQKDQARRQPTIMRLVGESIILLDTDGRGAALQRECAAEVLAGPRPLTPDELASARYGVTDLLTDLEGATDPDERVAVSVTLWQDAARLVLTGTGRWAGTGKGLARELRAYDQAAATTFGAGLLRGLRASIADHPALLIAACDRVLELFGGRHFDGHRLSGEVTSP